MNKLLEEAYRNEFEEQVTEKILGPGYAKELFLCNTDASDEILDDDPTKLYCTGVMMPMNSDSSSVDDSEEQDGGDSEADEVLDNIAEDNSDDDSSDGGAKSDDHKQEQEERTFFRSDHIGIITCVSSETASIQLDVSYAKYEQLKDISEAKVMAGTQYETLKSLIHENNEVENVRKALNDKKLTEPFSSYFIFDDDKKLVSLRTPLDSSLRSALKKVKPDQPEADAQQLLMKLLAGRFYRRLPREVKNIQLPISKKIEPKELNADLKCFIKTFEQNGNQYVKVILQNKLKRNEDEGFYKGCLFQTMLKLTPVNGTLITYTEPVNSLDDSENNITEFCYREVVNYGKGIGCAVRWDEAGHWIETTYMPRCEVKKFSNEIDDPTIKDICTLRNISKWSSLSNSEICDRLTVFVDGYEKWHLSEKKRTQGVNQIYSNAVTDILLRQEQLLERLRDNLAFMRKYSEAMECFKIANTAMLIQMVVSRDSNFEKNRDTVNDNEDIFNSIKYFEDATYLQTMPKNAEPSYRPFQLAFLLMNVKSTLVENDPYRTKFVDLIWFPTGGGKTEAYLALTALTITARRRNSADIISGYSRVRDANYTSGVSVIMRYTLRLLTSQQFERASFLICALDFLRITTSEFGLGKNRISIGLWIGKSASPNKIAELRDTNEKYKRFLEGLRENNPFPVAYCPWCGKKLKESSTNHGYDVKHGHLGCLNDSCCFMEDTKLPIYYVDEVVYKERPTLLFATVDKFAQLYTKEAASLIRGNGYKSPDLVIQDELHLISGPLGSTVALFESMVEEMASNDGHSPKIIASTATTRNTGALIKSLYGKDKEVNIFPAQGVSYADNYFSHLENEALRCHIGIMPTGWTTSNDTEIRLTAVLLLSRLKLAAKILTDAGINPTDLPAVVSFLRNLRDLTLIEDADIFWSIVLYYNSLKDLGRSKSRVSQEVYETVRAKKMYFQIPKTLSFLYEGFDKRTKEFTSREDSSRIKDLLTAAESPVRLVDATNQSVRVDGKSLDLIFASNMISVGIDIARWNLMVMMGQPRSTAEYIQSSSRAARSHMGLVFNLINPRRNREFSLFENYTSFHAAYYKYVEPLSATPINMQMLRLPLWVNILHCYRDYLCDTPDDKTSVVDGVIQILKNRYVLDKEVEEEIAIRLSDIFDNPQETEMMSLRDIDKDCYMMIKNVNY